MNDYKLTFIIAMKYYRGYESYLKYYVENIHKFYLNSLIIIIDNNSTYKDDVFDQLKDYSNVILLDNDIESKFELGSYQVGIKYLINHNLLDSDYYIFTQDNFILKNRYDFNILGANNIMACPINSFHYDGYMSHIVSDVLSKINLNNNMDKITFCWANSFIVHKQKIMELYNYIKNIVIKVRVESEASERYMARILWELNNYVNFDIDGPIQQQLYEHSSPAAYDCDKVNPYDKITGVYFLKKVQQKNENTTNK